MQDPTNFRILDIRPHATPFVQQHPKLGKENHSSYHHNSLLGNMEHYEQASIRESNYLHCQYHGRHQHFRGFF